MMMKEDLYSLIDSMLAVSYLVEDLTLLNHWDRVIGIGKLNDPDFLKKLPRTSSEVLLWIKSNEKFLKEIHDKIQVNVDKTKKKMPSSPLTDSRNNNNNTKDSPMAAQILDILQLAYNKETKEEIIQEMESLRNIHYDASGDVDDDDVIDTTTTTTDHDLKKKPIVIKKQSSKKELKEQRECETQQSLSKIIEITKKKDTKEDMLQEIQMLRTMCEIRTFNNEPKIPTPTELLLILQRASQQETTDDVLTVLGELAPNAKKFDPYFHLKQLETLVQRDKERYEQKKKNNMIKKKAEEEEKKKKNSNNNNTNNIFDSFVRSLSSLSKEKINDEQDDDDDEDESSILHIDDMYAFNDLESEVVWSITKNPYLKRITLIFRGSKTKKDWLQDIKFFDSKPITINDISLPTTTTTTTTTGDGDVAASKNNNTKSKNEKEGQDLDNNEDGQDDNSSNDENEVLHDFDEFTIHKGFYEYLFETENHKLGDLCNNNSKDSNDSSTAESTITTTTTTKYQEILYRCHMIMKDLPDDYSLYITGHSLGAALATITATSMAITGFCCNKNKPIRLISFASPHVGKRSFADLFQKIEVSGRIEHLRITNSDDLVPMALGSLGFVHVGCHLNLREVSWFTALDNINNKKEGTNNDNSNDSNTNNTNNNNKSLYDLDRSSNTVVGKLFTNKMTVNPGRWATGNPSHQLVVYKERLDTVKNALQAKEIGTFDDVCVKLLQEDEEREKERQQKKLEANDNFITYSLSSLSDHIEKNELSFVGTVLGLLLMLFIVWKTWVFFDNIQTIQIVNDDSFHDEM